jgi:hypothetical protein
MMKALVVSLVASGAVLLACSGGGGSTSSNTSAAGGDFPSQYCAVMGPCCGKVNKTYNAAQCTTVLTAIIGSRTYDPAQAQKCVDAARADSASPTFCDDGLSDATDDICDKVFSAAGGGTKKPGETCESSSDCASSPEGEVSCSFSSNGMANTQTCRLEVNARENEACEGTRVDNFVSYTGIVGTVPRVAVCDTAEGLFCDRTTKKCLLQQGPGGTCDGFASYGCRKDAYCDSATRMCVARKMAGADCATGATDQCADDYYCDMTTKKCALKVSGGQACTASAQCKNGSCTNGKCSTNTGTDLFCQ